MEQLNDLERIIMSNPLKAMAIVVEMENLHEDLRLLNSSSEVSSHTAAYANLERHKMLLAYPLLIPGERVWLNLYQLINTESLP